jgi:lactoylglutathione lyase
MKARDAFPILYVTDVARSERFYRDAFGFEPEFRWPTGGPAEYIFLRLEPLGIGIGAANGENVHGNPVVPGSGSFELCLYVDDIEEACARLRTLGAKELRPPVAEPWGENRAYFADPDGNTLHIAMTR